MIEQLHARNMPNWGTLGKGHCAQHVLYLLGPIRGRHFPVSTKTNLKQLRAKKGLSQTELAEKVGTTLNMYGKLERGDRRLNMDWLERLAAALEVGMHEIVAEMETEEGGEQDLSVPLPTLDALKATLAEHYQGVSGTSMPDEMLNDLAERMLDSVQNWQGDPAAATDPQVARSVARQINRRYVPQ